MSILKKILIGYIVAASPLWLFFNGDFNFRLIMIILHVMIFYLITIIVLLSEDAKEIESEFTESMKRYGIGEHVSALLLAFPEQFVSKVIDNVSLEVTSKILGRKTKGKRSKSKKFEEISCKHCGSQNVLIDKDMIFCKSCGRISKVKT